MKSPWLTRLVFAILAGSIFLLFINNQLSDKLADPDAFYHMKMAQLMVQQGVIKDFWWLPYTTLSQHYIDQHLLFHVLMIPFVTFGNAFVGIKIFASLLGTLALVLLARLLWALKLRWWLPMSVLLALTVTFTFRMNLVKATPLSLILLYGIIWCLAQRKYYWLMVLNVVYVWTYGGFAIALIITLTWFISQCITIVTNSTWRQRDFWLEQSKLIGAVLGGMILGVIINPYFPNNLYFYWDQLVQIGIINYQDKIGVGSEWYPYEPSQLLLSSLLLTISALGGLLTIIIKRKRLTQLDWFGLGLAVIGTVLTFKSRRYVEYFGPFITIAAAIWLDHLDITWWQVKRWLTGALRPLLSSVALLVVVFIQVLPIIVKDQQQNMNDVRGGIPINKYQAAASWLASHGEPHTKVLHSDWDDFPSLFYYDSKHAYMAGLDPTFMYRYNQELYWLWVNITIGKYNEDIDAALHKLNVKYVFIEQDHRSMYQLIKKSKQAVLVYHDNEASIFAIQ
ncbi:MAG: hypothetical protein WCW27_00030 [Patescibacteria group bacterium]|jgi:hypothetical protein